MGKRKNGEETAEGDQTIPLPIQTFLWRQSSAFIRPKLGKMTEASCMSFERVLVQNIHHGLSPSLCEAIQSISRWKLIQGAFPHVMHCCGSLLHARKQSDPHGKFTTAQTKLLYTLHWILLDSASECEDSDAEKPTNNNKAPLSYMHSIDTVQLFVYLFAPLVSSLRESDFQSLKLESGLRLWQAIWEFRQPDILCFSTPVKPKRTLLKAQRQTVKIDNTNAANIFMGQNGGADDGGIFLGFDSPELAAETHSPTEVSPSHSVNHMAPIARMSDICDSSSISDSRSIMEVICEICNGILHSKQGEPVNCICKTPRNSVVSFSDPTPTQKSQTTGELPNVGTVPDANEPVDKDYIQQSLRDASRGAIQQDVLMASYFDVAVLRCLFCSNWCEDGVYWALRYIHNRLLDICDEIKHSDQTRERSKSLPIPDIKVSVYASPQLQRQTSRSANFSIAGRIEPAPKKFKVSELKSFFEPRIPHVRKLDENSPVPPVKLVSPATDNPNIDVTAVDSDSRSNSPLGKVNEEENELSSSTMSDSMTDLVRQQSMPTLVSTSDNVNLPVRNSSSPNILRHKIDQNMTLKPELLNRPIITITQDTPSSPTVSEWSKTENGKRGDTPGGTLTRSLTDSNISYKKEPEVTEVSGSVHYIQQNGQLNYKVILKSLHAVSSGELSARVCAVVLNILNCLMDLEVIEKKEKKAKKAGSKEEKQEELLKKPRKKTNEMGPHNLAMDTLIRVFKSIGCPHGCGDGYRGASGEHLRSQGQDCLSRLQRLNPVEFRRYMQDVVQRQPLQDIIDFLHAFLGFCVDPSTSVYSPQGMYEFLYYLL
ncbi:unnamed protein product [Owenia fusiformis]|uniref:Uncharacterized protein n=1 Tax=Owenia fusiformis TaxID=6347 RepID=A0A8J1V000_OWEFU|nr:unnamed protein product [Owenia fusiformis]